jgi:hypothetical protein
MKTDQSTFWIYKGVIVQSDLRSKNIVVRNSLQDLAEEDPAPDPSLFDIPNGYQLADIE